MRDPVPLHLHREGAPGRAGRVIAIVQQGRDWPAQKRIAFYWSVRQRIAQAHLAERRSRPRALLFARAAAVTAALGAAAFAAGLLRAPAAPAPESPAASVASAPAAPAWQSLRLEGVGELEASPPGAAQLAELAQERQVRLDAGKLRAHITRQDPARPVAVVTPHLRIVVVGTRFDVEVDRLHTQVSVLEGRVRVESNAARILLGPGASIRSDDPSLGLPDPFDSPASTLSTAGPSPTSDPFVAGGAEKTRERPPALRRRAAAPQDEMARLALRATSVAECEEIPALRLRRTCLERLAEGDGITAETALYALGLMARTLEGRPGVALRHFRRYQARFPAGVLAPEAALGALEMLRAQDRLVEAEAAAASFERRFTGDERVPEVALIRAELLCRMQRVAEGRAVLEKAMALSPAAPPAAARVRAACGLAGAESDETSRSAALGPDG